VGSQQRVEILKALYRGALLLILDEPTAVLTPGEVEELFQNLRFLAAQGHGVIFISHKLEEVMAISQRVTVLRAGRRVATVETAKTHPRELARMMVGRDILFDVEKGVGSRGGPVLEVRALRARNDRKGEALKEIDLTLRAGEILGIAAVAGNGERELAEVLTGLRRATGGKVFLLGEDVTNRSPAQLIRRGVGHIPEDRHRFGLILDLTVAENAVLELHAAPPFARRGFLDWGAISRFAEGLISHYDVKTWGAQAQARTLSGGNQQKLILAREMARRPRLLIAVHPTRGLDVAATEYVHRQLLAMRAGGTAILLMTPELEELFSLSDRLAVLYEGRVTGVFEASEADVETVGRLMAGARGPGARFSVDATPSIGPIPLGPDVFRGPA
jgi:simple sugar transport system ATP-binding protein